MTNKNRYQQKIAEDAKEKEKEGSDPAFCTLRSSRPSVQIFQFLKITYPLLSYPCLIRVYPWLLFLSSFAGGFHSIRFHFIRVFQKLPPLPSATHKTTASSLFPRKLGGPSLLPRKLGGLRLLVPIRGSLSSVSSTMSLITVS